MNIRQIMIWFVVFAGFLAASAARAEPVALRVHQATAVPPRITAYATVEDETGASVTDVTAAQFSATVGDHPAKVETVHVFAASDEGLAYLFLVDLSRSLKDSEFAQLRKALTEWIGTLRSQDRGALLTFSEQVRLEQDFTADKAALQKKITALRLHGQETHLHQGLIRALELGRRQGTDLPQRRVIVVFSDGMDDAIGNATRTEVIEALKVDRVPIYAVGLYSPPKTAAKEQGLKALGELARLSGGGYQDGAATPLATALAALRQRLGQTLVIPLHCTACPADGRPYRLQLSLQAGQQRLESGLDVRLQPASPLQSLLPAVKPASESAPPTPATEQPWAATALAFFKSFWGPIIIGVGVGMLVLIGRGLIHRRRQSAALPTPSSSALDAPAPAPDSPAPTIPSPTAPHTSAPPTPAPALTVLLTTMRTQPAHVYRLDLAHRAVIGRRSDCAVVIADSKVSETHCALSREGDRVFIEDLGSTNGTSLNGVRLTRRHPLQTDDRLLLGGIELRVTIGP